jgi:hypothetical protein
MVCVTGVAVATTVSTIVVADACPDPESESPPPSMGTTEYEALATTIGSDEVVRHCRKGNAKAGEVRDDMANKSETGRVDFILKDEGNTQSVERERGIIFGNKPCSV